MSIARKEARETLYWLKLLDSEGLLLSASADELLRECDSIVATLTAIVKTSQLRRNESK
jgi:four helix bundle protein